MELLTNSDKCNGHCRMWAFSDVLSVYDFQDVGVLYKKLSLILVYYAQSGTHLPT